MCKLQMDFIFLLCPQLKCTFIFVVDLQPRRVCSAFLSLIPSRGSRPAFNRPVADNSTGTIPIESMLSLFYLIFDSIWFTRI